MNPDAARYYVYKTHIYSSGRRESDGKSALNDLCDDPVDLESRIHPVYRIVFNCNGACGLSKVWVSRVGVSGHLKT